MPAETLSRASESALSDFSELAALSNDYRNPGRAYRLTQGLLLGYIKTLEEKILAGETDQFGEDLTPFLRAQWLTARYILAIPETIRRELLIQEQQHTENAPQVDLPLPQQDLDKWPTFD